jgi:hypothetical protein
VCTADASGDGVVDYREGVVTLARSRYMCFVAVVVHLHLL